MVVRSGMMTLKIGSLFWVGESVRPRSEVHLQGGAALSRYVGVAQDWLLGCVIWLTIKGGAGTASRSSFPPRVDATHDNPGCAVGGYRLWTQNCCRVLPHYVALPAPNNCHAQAPRQVTAPGGYLLTNVSLDWVSRISASKVWTQVRTGRGVVRALAGPPPLSVSPDQGQSGGASLGLLLEGALRSGPSVQPEPIVEDSLQAMALVVRST
jgi:hypothetical protein